VKSIGSLNALFKSTAQQFHLPEEIQKTVDAISESTRSATAADVMTKNIASLDASLCVQDAAEAFQRHPHSTYPVTEEGKVIGLLRRSVAYDWLKKHGLTCRDGLKDLPLTTPFCVRGEVLVPELVQTLMRTGVSKADFYFAVRRMLRNHVSSPCSVSMILPLPGAKPSLLLNLLFPTISFHSGVVVSASQASAPLSQCWILPPCTMILLVFHSPAAFTALSLAGSLMS